MELKTAICTATGAVGGWIASLYGGWDAAVVTLVICMAVDYISGLVVAGVFHASKKSATGALESRAGFKGLCRKGMILLPVLSEGMKESAAVKSIQRICFARGCLDNAGKPLAVDGDFGSATKQAVIQLQRQIFPNAPDKWDGEVGSETWTAALTKLW